MAYKQKGFTPFTKPYGTSSKDLSHLTYEERQDYRSWKKSERQAGRKGAHHDNTYEAYLSSKKTKKSKNKNRKGLGIGDWVSDNIKLGDGGKKLLPSTIAERRKQQTFLGSKKV